MRNIIRNSTINIRNMVDGVVGGAVVAVRLTAHTASPVTTLRKQFAGSLSGCSPSPSYPSKLAPC
ncbi:MAG: hypothetical protein ACRC1K_00085, partial [Planctomycetia bacterium]